MNSIIKQITYDQFSTLIGNQKVQSFITKYHSQNQQNFIILCFIADWSVPSRTAIKKLKKKNINKQKVGIIDVDLVDSIDLCQKYQIKSVPHFILLKNRQIISQFYGCRLQMIYQMFSKLNNSNQQNSSKPQKIQKCLNGHKLSIMNRLQYPPYIDSYFYCNKCKKIQQCSPKFNVAHCQICDYDICQTCFNY